jgi:D-amino peptidase
MNSRICAAGWLRSVVVLSVVFVTTALPDIARAQAQPGAAAARVLVIHDMEGLAGEGDWRHFMFSQPEFYRQGQFMLVADVNAVIAGLFDGGATAVDVLDAHGSGNPEPDIPLHLLDQRATLIMRDAPVDPDIDLLEPTKYDAVALVGMHAKTGSGGFASHTINPGLEVQLNGKSVTESEWFGYSWGRVGVPVIFDAGDDKLQSDIRGTMPWVKFVVTKRATSASTAELRPVEEVHAEMRRSAKEAMQQRANATVMKLAYPVRTTLRAVAPASLEVLSNVPGLDYSNGSVSFTAADLPTAYKGLLGLARVATLGYTQLLTETLRNTPNGLDVMNRYRVAVFERWMDNESSRWTPPRQPVLPPGRKYHGSN